MITKKIIFSEKEKKILRTVLELRLEFLKILSELYSPTKNILEVSLKEANILLKLLLDHDAISLNSGQKGYLCGCINENLDIFNKGVPLIIQKPANWVNLSEEQIERLMLLDTCSDILKKCGFYKKHIPAFDHSYRFHQTLTTIEKLIKCETVVLSKSGDRNYYRIAFVHDSEAIEFELSDSICWRNKTFASINSYRADTYRNPKYSVMTSKSMAKDELEFNQNTHYDRETNDFLRKILLVS